MRGVSGPPGTNLNTPPLAEDAAVNAQPSVAGGRAATGLEGKPNGLAVLGAEVSGVEVASEAHFGLSTVDSLGTASIGHSMTGVEVGASLTASIAVTADADLAPVALALDGLLANVGSKPADVTMPAAFSTALPELQQSVSTADIPPAILSSLAELPDAPGKSDRSFGDSITRVDSTLFDQVIGQSPLGKEKVLDELMGKVREQLGPFVSAAADDAMNAMRKEAGKGSRKDMENQIKARSEGKRPLGVTQDLDIKRPIVRAERVEPRAEPEPQASEPRSSGPNVQAPPPPAAPAPTPASLRNEPPPQPFEEITIPGPDIVALERNLGGAFDGLDLSNVDIDALLQIVMLACAKESATDLRQILKEVQANNARKKTNREQVTEIKEQRAAMLGSLRKDYDQRCSLPAGNDLYIDSSRMSFDDFCKAQPLRLLQGDPRATDANGDFAGGLAFAVSPNTFYQSKEAAQVLDARGNVISPGVVLQADRLKLQPQALQSLLDVWNSDPQLRVAHASFEAFLVGPTTQGGLGLVVGAASAQDSKVAAFLVAHQSAIDEAQKKRAEQPPQNPPAGNPVSLRSISTEARALQAEFPTLKDEDLRALTEPGADVALDQRVRARQRRSEEQDR